MRSNGRVCFQRTVLSKRACPAEPTAKNASLYFTEWSTPTKKGTRALIGLRSTAGLMAGIVYGGDIQSIGTDH